MRASAVLEAFRRLKHRTGCLVGPAALLLAGTVQAQWGGPEVRDWQETEAPTPPPLSTQRLIPIEVPRSALTFGVDAASLQIGKDGIVRYVVVTRNPDGVVAGIYEGINCRTAEVKVYAHHNPGTGWSPVRQPRWVDLSQGMHARYSLTLARAGVCEGPAPNRSAEDIARDLGMMGIQRFIAPGSRWNTN